MNNAAPAGRKPRPTHVFEVDRTERVSPHMVRVRFRGEGVERFIDAIPAERIGITDLYVKLLFARPELGLALPYDMEALREELAPHDMPSRRTYTIREIDRLEQAVAIDFVVHGDEGIAGPWAAAAGPGDRVCLMGPGGNYAPSPDVDEHLFFGDDSALPAIAASIEAADPDARGLAVIEVGSAADEIVIDAPLGIEVRWVHRDGSAHGDALVAAVEALDAPANAVDVFAHGEREAMKRLRPLIHKEWGIERSRLSLSGYWAYGRAEDTFQAEKNAPIGQIFEPEAPAA
ncbi:siderophore-interacting protein [Microbacterium halophytorum]|uniref:siderophore-interacting protein n=1 Tax=Microbacterium halophytorum TaxID=2067568 RepID=UPI000CFB0ED3|nr:siderophore-interacting protein [Microbacterium halophytorum]